MCLLVVFANHRDAIANGFITPIVQISANGELDVDERFYSTVLTKYFTRRGIVQSDRAAANYDSYFPPVEVSSSKIDVQEIAELDNFDKYFRQEFGFSIHLYFKLRDELRTLAVTSGNPANILPEDGMFMFLDSCGFQKAEANAFLDRFALPIRSGWNKDLPKRCRSEDVYPWRFRRQLSLYLRPLVVVGLSPRAWAVSAPAFERSFRYVLNHLEHGRFPEVFFQSREMRTFVGRIANQRGHQFAQSVEKAFASKGFKTKLELELTQLGASKRLGLGDIDVLAWDPGTGQTYVVECKRLLPARTVREVVQRLEEFHGDKEAKDSLGRHLRRIEWLKQYPAPVSKFTTIPVSALNINPLLVTSETMPMQFFRQMQFPTEQVIPIADLRARFGLPNES
jgi:hypothetical protein